MNLRRVSSSDKNQFDLEPGPFDKIICTGKHTQVSFFIVVEPLDH